MLVKNFSGHLKTIIMHRNMVLIHCIKAGIIWRGLIHDLSKFSITEFIPGVRYFQGSRSPNEMERETYGYSKAWMHHKGRNRHHFEYWTDYNPKTKNIEPVKMPDVFIYEMFCDRVAASKTYNRKNYNDYMPLQYFQRSRHKETINYCTCGKLELLLIMLSEKGEKETFAYIRNERKKSKNK